MHFPVGISTSLFQFKPKGGQNSEKRKKINSIHQNEEKYDEQKS